MFGTNLPLIKEEHFSIEDMKEFYLEATYENVSIRLIESNEITVRQYGEPFVDKEYTSSFKDGILHLYFPSRNSRIIDFSLIGKNLRVEIQIPQKYSNAITLITSSGTIKISGEPTWGNTTMESKSGSINIDKINSESLSLVSSSGSINFDSCTVKNISKFKASSGSLNFYNIKSLNSSIETTSGSIRARNIEVSDELMLSSSSGSMRIENISCQLFNIHLTSGSLQVNSLIGKGNIFTSSGSIKINSFKILGDSQMNTSSGSVQLSMSQSDNYTLNLKTSSGNINCSKPLSYEGTRKNNATGTVGDGLNGTLSITTSSGSIHIR